MKFSPVPLVILTLSVLQPAISEVTMTVTNDIVFSGNTATLTCSVAADNGETVIVKQWKDSSANVIGNAAGDFEKNDVLYKIVELETTGEQVFSWAIEVRLLTMDMSLKCWALPLVNGKPVEVLEETGQIDVVAITSSNTVTLTGESTSVTCGLTGASSEANTTVQWSQHGSPITGEEGSYSLSTEYSGSDKVAVLTASSLTSDETFTCTFSGTGGGSVSSTVNIDHVTITPSSYNVTGNQTTGTLSCVLSGANQTPIKTKWLRGDESEITGTDPGFEFYSSVPYENGQETFLLFVDPATESSVFTCCFEFIDNVCKTAVALLEVSKEKVIEDIGEGEGDNVEDTDNNNTGIKGVGNPEEDGNGAKDDKSK